MRKLESDRRRSLGKRTPSRSNVCTFEQLTMAGDLPCPCCRLRLSSRLCCPACACQPLTSAKYWSHLCCSSRRCPGAPSPKAPTKAAAAAAYRGMLAQHMRGAEDATNQWLAPAGGAHPRDAWPASSPHVRCGSRGLTIPSRCRDLKRHLLSVEERCLESLAWQQGSSLYAALAAAVGTETCAAGAVGSQARQAGEEPAQAGQGSAGQGFGGSGSSCVTPRKRGRGEMAAAEARPDAEMVEAAAAPAPAAEEAAAQEAQQTEAAPAAPAGLPLSLGADLSGAGLAAVAAAELPRAAPAAGAAAAEVLSGAQQHAAGQAGAVDRQQPSLAARGDRSARVTVSAGMQSRMEVCDCVRSRSAGRASQAGDACCPVGCRPPPVHPSTAMPGGKRR